MAAAALAAAAAAVAAIGDSRPTVALTPVADAYVRADRPASNFGKASVLVVGSRPASIAYLRFRVTMPRAAAVTHATLQLFARQGSTAFFTVHPVASTAWSETKTTYANAPPVKPRVVARSGSYRGGGYVSIAVTSFVSRGGLVTLAVKGRSTRSARFNSREARSGRPRLLVRLSTVSGAPEGSSGVPTTTTPPGGDSTGGGPPDGGSPGSGGAGSGGGGGGGSGGSGGGGLPSAMCGTVTAPPQHVDHVIWIFMENKPYDAIIGSSSAPFENQLAAACGVATNYHAVAHPSLPNYIAATSGDTQGITDDDPPSSHPLAVPSIFSQVKAVGKAWRAYEESAPARCASSSSGTYAVKHNPPPYYTGIAANCGNWDVPMGSTSGGAFLSDLTANTLPAFSYVTPDLCSDTHDCSVATGDAWLSVWFAKIFASPAYLSGSTVVFLAWDENDGSASNHVPLIVVSPSVHGGTQSGGAFDHHALLKTTEQLLGLGYLGHAGDPGTASMASAFNLG